MGRLLLSCALGALCCSAQAAPGVGLAASEQPQVTAKAAAGMARPMTWGLCEAPQNADAFPSQPVPVQEDQCSYYQRFEATSIGPSHGDSCGGFTVAFGPMGDLKTNWTNRDLEVRWADEPLTQAQCAKARVSAIAWGARCATAECSSAVWEKLGGPSSKKGYWQTVSKICITGHTFVGKKDAFYKTLNVDVIATLIEDGQTVRKRAAATISGRRGNGKCASIGYTPPSAKTPVRAASGISIQERHR